MDWIPGYRFSFNHQAPAVVPSEQEQEKEKENQLQGRLVGGEKKQHFLLANDEKILKEIGIEITGHLGEGFFGNVWKGRYTTATNTTTTDPLSPSIGNDNYKIINKSMYISIYAVYLDVHIRACICSCVCGLGIHFLL